MSRGASYRDAPNCVLKIIYVAFISGCNINHNHGRSKGLRGCLLGSSNASYNFFQMARGMQQLEEEDDELEISKHHFG